MKVFFIIVGIVVIVGLGFLSYRYLNPTAISQRLSDNPMQDVSVSTSSLYEQQIPNVVTVVETVSSSTIDSEGDQILRSNDVLGEWQVENNFYEFITMSPDYTYSIFLENQLLYAGTWNIEDGVLILLSDVGPVTREEMRVVSYEDEKILFNSEESPVVWKKV